MSEAGMVPTELCWETGLQSGENREAHSCLHVHGDHDGDQSAELCFMVDLMEGCRAIREAAGQLQIFSVHT